MSLSYVVIGVPFFIWIARNTLFWTSLWQIKEYRFDRVFIHLRETRQGRNLLFSKLSIIKLLAIPLYIFVILNSKLLLPYQYLVGAIFLLEFYLVLREIFLNIYKVPVLTLKSLAILVSTFLVILLLFFVPLMEGFFWLLILDRLAVLLLMAIVILLSFPTEIYRDFIIGKAIKKIKDKKDLLVIGITGSYGKSSTKNYVSQILENNFNVLKTEGTNNTPIGIANTILSGLNENTKIFVVEMGAYKKGEISQMCEIVHPKIGILTAVSNQHLSLFKTLQNAMDTKYELIKSLPSNGLALFNGNDKNAYFLYKRTKKKKLLYKVNRLAALGDEKLSISAFNVVIGKKHLDFDVMLGKKIISDFRTPLIGEHNIEDILPGIYIADYLGMKNNEIRKAVLSLRPLKKTMNLYENLSGVTLVDDSFNASPDAVLAATDYMKIFNKKRILVLQPMIELGKNAAYEHWRVAKEISQICDYLLLTNKNFNDPILKGVEEGDGSCIVKTGNSQYLAEFIKKNAQKGDVVVFEGKESGFVFERVL